MKRHRYEQIAKALAEQIGAGKFAVGDSLPTEARLCSKYGVSRYTAREALRQLREAGLITRRPRAGSTVTAARGGSTFSLPVSSAADLFRYATDARFVIERRERIHADSEDMAVLECRRGQEWIKLSGIRRRPGVARPVCLIQVYLNVVLAGLEATLPRSPGVIYPRVEKALGIRIAWIGQRIEAVKLPAAEAQRLGSVRDGCGLRVRRYYYDANDRLLEVSDSLHAGEDFAYEMRLKRD
ncbi:MAG: GntR family transcriptional regulator [Betaproteobacteria bacterium]